jgi:hypothetical protein
MVYSNQLKVNRFGGEFNKSIQNLLSGAFPCTRGIEEAKDFPLIYLETDPIQHPFFHAWIGVTVVFNPDHLDQY